MKLWIVILKRGKHWRHANTHGLFLWDPYNGKIMVLYLAYVRNKFYKSDVTQYMAFAVNIQNCKEQRIVLTEIIHTFYS